MTQSKARERRAALLREFEISGLSLAEFCRRAGLAYSTVLGWRRKAREGEAPASQGFVVVEALPPEAEAGPQAGRGGSPVAGECADRCGGPVVMGQNAEAPEPKGWSAAVSGAAPPWRVELELPGGLILRIYGECPDRGGGGFHQREPAGKGGAP
jgi:hypothetical protein